MIHKHLVAAIIVSLSSALLCASCADLDPGGSAPETEEAGGEPTNEASQAAYENIFKFVQTIKDDGKGKGGGWQEAAVSRVHLWKIRGADDRGGGDGRDRRSDAQPADLGRGDDRALQATP